MVWGLSMPSSFGDYFPNGDYVGWDEELGEYYDEKMPAAQKGPFLERGPIRYFRYVAAKFIYELGDTFADMPAITPIEKHEAPKCFETAKTYSSLGSLMILNDRLWAVDQELKDIIERLEPGLHQFFPLQISMPKKVVYPKQYYVMVIRQFLDSFSPEKSVEGVWEKRANGYYSVFTSSKKYVSGLAFSKNSIGNAHLWKERHLYTPEILFSDELQAEVVKNGLRLPKYFQMKAVQ
jgi:hypothetical protein